MAIANVAICVFVALDARGHCKRNGLPVITLPLHAVDLPDVTVAVCASNLPIVALPCVAIVCTSDLPVVALATRGHC